MVIGLGNSLLCELTTIYLLGLTGLSYFGESFAPRKSAGMCEWVSFTHRKLPPQQE